MNAAYEAAATPMLTFELELAHAPADVWAAITEPGELEHWFPCAVSGPMTLGAELEFTFPGHEIEPMRGEVTEFDPPRRLSFTWGADHLHFALDPAASGTRLRFTVELDGAAKAARDAAGWHVCLDRLARQLDAGDALAPEPAQTGEWRAHYDRYRAAGLPADAPLPD
jgi:uncharacterized protein YndB with AHSA1/START domain